MSHAAHFARHQRPSDQPSNRSNERVDVLGGDNDTSVQSRVFTFMTEPIYVAKGKSTINLLPHMANRQAWLPAPRAPARP